MPAAAAATLQGVRMHAQPYQGKPWLAAAESAGFPGMVRASRLSVCVCRGLPTPCSRWWSCQAGSQADQMPTEQSQSPQESNCSTWLVSPTQIHRAPMPGLAKQQLDQSQIQPNPNATFSFWHWTWLALNLLGTEDAKVWEEIRAASLEKIIVPTTVRSYILQERLLAPEIS